MLLIESIYTKLLTHPYEANGGRAHSVGNPIHNLPIKETILYAWGTIKHFNISLLFLALLNSMGAHCIYFKKQSRDIFDKAFITTEKISVISLVITIIFLVLLCAKSTPNYLGRGDVLVSPAFSLFLIIFLNLVYIIKQYPKLQYILPIVVLFFCIEAMNNLKFYTESTIGRLSPAVCVNVDNDIIQQIVKADENGKTKMILNVPKNKSKSNWPHPDYMGNVISSTLYRHGLIQNSIEIQIRPDVGMNEKYGIKVH